MGTTLKLPNLFPFGPVAVGESITYFVFSLNHDSGKLLKWTSEDGIIHEETLQNLDKKRQYDKIEMEMALAHVNVLKNLIDYQKRTKNLKFV